MVKMPETAKASSGLPHVVIHTDGACSGNPGPGGWGAILAFGAREKELNGGEPHTTHVDAAFVALADKIPFAPGLIPIGKT